MSLPAAATSPRGARPQSFGRSTAFILVTLVLTTRSVCLAGPSRLIEVADESTTYVGKIIAMDSTHCRLQDRFGRMEQLPVANLKNYRVVAEQYRPATAAEMREQLRRELPGYEISGSTHYLVVGSHGRSQSYSTLFEEMYRQVEQFYRVRGFRTRAPETVLAAIVFGSHDEFVEYCRRDDVPSPATLRGYYSYRSNRVVLFDDPRFASSTSSTIVHEATHQVGHNIGIHSRLGGTPTWILEGLATVLEAPGMRTGQKKVSSESRYNSERLNWYRTEYARRRQPGDVARMVASDEPFQKQTLDAYSNAWALTYFMSENPARTRQFASYIHKLENRESTGPATSEERLKDFQAAFGDIARLEVEFLRFMDRLP